MYKNKILENLELKLAKTREENKEKLDKIEKNFKEEYFVFLEKIFENDNSWIKRLVSVLFQIEKLDNLEKNNSEIFNNSLKKSIENLSLSKEKKDLLLSKISVLEKNKNFLEEKILKNSDITKDTNFPILEDLVEKWVLEKSNLIDISLRYKEKNNFLESLKVLEINKFEIVKSHFFQLNNTKKIDRIDNFKNEFSFEIENSENAKIYPTVVNFVWKNYLKLRLPNKTETRLERLKRAFKIAFLKLNNLKFSGIDINEVLRKLESLDDFDVMFNLILKYFEELKNNPNLQKDFLVSSDLEEAENLVNEAEDNKQKSIFTEENIVKATSIIEETEKKLTAEDLEKILSDEVDLVWWNFIHRWVLSDKIEEEKESKEVQEEDLMKMLEELKEKVFEIDEEKRKMFLIGKYEKIDALNDELIEVLKKLEKLKKLLWIADVDEENEEENKIML